MTQTDRRVVALRLLAGMDRSLGLRRHIVRLAPHDPSWSRAFEEVAPKLREAVAFSGALVEHAGSTAVPGLVAKPILDIVVGLPDPAHTDEVARRIADTLGFIDRGPGEGSIGRLLVFEPEPDVRTIHVHIVECPSENWLHYIGFRDALRRDPTLRARYAAVKRRLAEEHSENRALYVREKSRFVEEVLRGLEGGAIQHPSEARGRAPLPGCHSGGR